MARLPERAPDSDRRSVIRVPADPYVRIDTCDYAGGCPKATEGRQLLGRVGVASDHGPRERLAGGDG